MKKDSERFYFMPAIISQRALIHGWLAQDHISQWIHGVGLQSTLTGLERVFERQTEDIEYSRQDAITQHWLGYENDRPFIYLLTSNVFKNTDNVYTQDSETDGPMITLDIFIGAPACLGKGLASLVIKEFLNSQFSDVTEIFIDPEQSNDRAVHVYQKVGFRIVGEFLAAWHPVLHYIMKLKPSQVMK